MNESKRNLKAGPLAEPDEKWLNQMRMEHPEGNLVRRPWGCAWVLPLRQYGRPYFVRPNSGRQFSARTVPLLRPGSGIRIGCVWGRPSQWLDPAWLRRSPYGARRGAGLSLFFRTPQNRRDAEALAVWVANQYRRDVTRCNGGVVNRYRLRALPPAPESTAPAAPERASAAG